MISLGFLHHIINDFFLSKRWVGGYGLLRDFPQAAAFSLQVNDRQRRRYIKFGRVPMPFIRFLRDAGVNFIKHDEVLRGITVDELENILMGSRSGRSQCVIWNESLESILKHLEYKYLIERNGELKVIYRLVAKYQNNEP